MSEPINDVLASIDTSFVQESASTRRRFVASAAGMLGGMGLLALPASAVAASSNNTPETILAVAATAEVLATIVNTVGPQKVRLDTTTRRNVLDAATQELIHYETLVSVGGRPVTKKIWVPDAVFASKKNLLETLVVGDGIFVNAYQIGITAFAKGGGSKGATYARYAAEFMGVESVHRALALQSLGRPGNDQVFASASNGRYFTDILTAVKELEHAGFGFGKRGKGPGRFYEFDKIKKEVIKTPEVHDRKPH